MKLSFPFILDDNKYKNIQEVKKKFYYILAKYKYNDEIREIKDISFINYMMKYHFINYILDNFDKKIINKYFVQSINIQDRFFKCLAIQFADNKYIKKISIQHFFNHPTAWQEFSQCCRNSISKQCTDFANDFKKRNKLLHLYGFHVDHHKPQFTEILLMFLEKYYDIKQQFKEGHIKYSREKNLEFINKDIKIMFQNFHKNKANLRMMTSFDNIRRPKIYVPDWVKNARPSYYIKKHENDLDRIMHIELV